MRNGITTHGVKALLRALIRALEKKGIVTRDDIDKERKGEK